MRLALILTIALSLAGCGDDDGGGDGTCASCGPYGEVLGALCGLIDRCPGSIYPIGYRDRAECVEILYFLFTCSLVDHEVNDVTTYEVVQHVPEVDQAQADACVAWLSTLSCDALSGGDLTNSPGGEACAAIFAMADFGSDDGVPDGSACQYSTDCLDDSRCVPPTVDPATGLRSCAACAPLPGDGEPCANESPSCGDGLYCASGETNLCRPLLPADAACTAANACASGFCNQRTMTCDAGGREGQPCTERLDCREGFCTADTSVCAPFLLGGEACGRDEECQNGNCDDATGVCGWPDGHACTSYEDVLCASGWCDDVTTLCAAAKADGETCQQGNECQSGYCDYSTQRCIAHCYTDGDCGDGEFCSWSSSRCEAKRPDDAACQDDEECLSGFCDQTELCQTRPGIGDPCTSSYACYPYGTCEGNVCVARKGPGEACEAYDACLEPYLCQEGRCQLMSLECRPGRTGESCAWLRVCDEESYCSYPDIRCVARKGQGEACSRPEECALTHYCDVTGGSPTCQPRQGEGGSCTSAETCQPGLFCAPESTGGGRCSAGPAGTPCSGPSTDVGSCPAGFFCQDYESCQPVHGLGEDCWYGEPCVDGLYCDSSEGCQPEPGMGEACDYDTPCADGFYCEDAAYPYMCQPAAQLGEACDTSSSLPHLCVAGLYCVWNGTMTACAEQKAPGEACSSDAECLSGACDSGYGCLASAECVAP